MLTKGDAIALGEKIKTARDAFIQAARNFLKDGSWGATTLIPFVEARDALDAALAEAKARGWDQEGWE